MECVLWHQCELSYLVRTSGIAYMGIMFHVVSIHKHCVAVHTGC